MAASALSYFFCENPVVNQVDFDGRDLLEVGCRDGRFTFDYLSNARSLLGLDPDAKAIEDLETHWSRAFPKSSADFRCGKIEDFPLPKESFDCVVFTRSF